MSERQHQIAAATEGYETNHPGHACPECLEVILVAAERAGYERGIGAPRRECGPLCSHLCCDKSGFDRGYERCKQDASKAIKELPKYPGGDWVHADAAQAAVAALGTGDGG